MVEKTLSEFSDTGKQQKLAAQKAKAVEMSAKQREISVAEFFEKNRHLLGFDNKRKALLTTVKEAVDNSLDACEEAGILPEVTVEINDMGNDRFRIVVEDNGPGIVKKQIPNIFAKLLYGSKFHSLRQSRGQQGIGISASVMYGQLTTGRAARITSRISPDEPAHYYELKLNTQKNEPEILADDQKPWTGKEHGTRIEIDLEASYQKGWQSVDEYLKQTSIVNPHVMVTYMSPKNETFQFPRAVEELPEAPKEIKPHPYGVELGMLIKMLQWTQAKTVKSFLREDFSRVGDKAAEEILQNAKVLPAKKPKEVSRDDAESLIEGIRATSLMMPPTDCISPIGEENLIKGLKKEVNAEFYAACTRPPSVYRGNPFVIECCTGDTKITLEDGMEVSIKKYVESDDERKVLSLDNDLKVVPAKVIAKQKFKNTHRLLQITTRTGRKLTITSNNEMPVVEDGEIVWKEADEVALGDFLAVPRRINVEGTIPLLVDLLPKEQVQVVDSEAVGEFIEFLSEKFGSLKKAAEAVHIDYNRLKSFKRKTCISRPYIDEFERMVLELGIDLSEAKSRIHRFRLVDNKFYNPKTIKNAAIDEDMLYVLGLLESDGYLSKSHITFVNNDEGLHSLFKSKVERCFGVEVKQDGKNAYFCSKTAYELLVRLKEKLLSLPDRLLISWIKGIVDGDGWVNPAKGEIGIATARRDMAQRVQSILLRIDIVSTITKKRIPHTNGRIGGRLVISKKEQHNIAIHGKANLELFKRFIGFRQAERAGKLEKMRNVTIDRWATLPAGRLLKEMRLGKRMFQHECGFSDQTIRQVEKGDQNMLLSSLQKVVQIVGEKDDVASGLLLWLEADVFCDKVVDIELMPDEESVYDLTVETENFVANNLIMHNCAIAYGGQQAAEGAVTIMRFANKVPLLFQQGACAATESIAKTNWRPYGLQQSGSNIPQGPATVLVHMASAWVPFTSEAKEALAHYPEIIKEVKLALQEVGRKLSKYTNKKMKIYDELKKRSYIEKYLPHLAGALKELLKLSAADEARVEEELKKMLERQRGKLEDVDFDPEKNEEYDEEFASIGREDEEEKGGDDS